MSKIGRKPIKFGSVKVEIKNKDIHYKGPKGSGIYQLPDILTPEMVDNNALRLNCLEMTRENKMLWGLHRALLASKLKGAAEDFAQQLIITGLGFKVQPSGNQLVCSLGYSHKINFELPKNIKVEVDKTGQNVVVKGDDKELVGRISSQIRALRPPEPYKGTGIKLANEHIIRKAGKTKAAA